MWVCRTWPRSSGSAGACRWPRPLDARGRPAARRQPLDLRLVAAVTVRPASHRAACAAVRKRVSPSGIADQALGRRARSRRPQDRRRAPSSKRSMASRRTRPLRHQPVEGGDGARSSHVPSSARRATRRLGRPSRRRARPRRRRARRTRRPPAAGPSHGPRQRRRRRGWPGRWRPATAATSPRGGRRARPAGGRRRRAGRTGRRPGRRRSSRAGRARLLHGPQHRVHAGEARRRGPRPAPPPGEDTVALEQGGGQGVGALGGRSTSPSGRSASTSDHRPWAFGRTERR